MSDFSIQTTVHDDRSDAFPKIEFRPFANDDLDVNKDETKSATQRVSYEAALKQQYRDLKPHRSPTRDDGFVSPTRMRSKEKLEDRRGKHCVPNAQPTKIDEKRSREMWMRTQMRLQEMEQKLQVLETERTRLDSELRVKEASLSATDCVLGNERCERSNAVCFSNVREKRRRESRKRIHFASKRRKCRSFGAAV